MRRVSTAVMAVFRHFAEAYGRRRDPFQVRFFVCATMQSPPNALMQRARRTRSRKGKPENKSPWTPVVTSIIPKNIFAPRRQKPEMADAGGDNGKHQDVAAQLCHGFKTVHDHGIQDASLCGCPVFCRFQVCQNRRAFFRKTKKRKKAHAGHI